MRYNHLISPHWHVSGEQIRNHLFNCDQSMVGHQYIRNSNNRQKWWRRLSKKFITHCVMIILVQVWLISRQQVTMSGEHIIDQLFYLLEIEFGSGMRIEHSSVIDVLAFSCKRRFYR